jgi:hypothetical protein
MQIVQSIVLVLLLAKSRSSISIANTIPFKGAQLVRRLNRPTLRFVSQKTQSGRLGVAVSVWALSERPHFWLSSLGEGTHTLPGHFMGKPYLGWDSVARDALA